MKPSTSGSVPYIGWRHPGSGWADNATLSIDNDIGPEVLWFDPGMEDGGPINVQVMLNTLS
jgi:hypothetical protein